MTFNDVLKWFYENWTSLSFIGIAVGGFWDLRQKQKATDIKIKEATGLANANEQNADADLLKSQAKQATTIADLAVEMNKDRRSNLELIIELQSTISKLQSELATTKESLRVAQESIEGLKLELQEARDELKTERREWNIERMELVQRLTKMEGDTHLDDTLTLSDDLIDEVNAIDESTVKDQSSIPEGETSL